jgi:tetratricopeptide (TPR) repeat protein
VLPFLALALLARRNIPLFSLVAAPALAANLADLGRRAAAGPALLRRLASGMPALVTLGLATCAAALLAGASSAVLGLPRERGLGVQPGLFPEDCLATLDRLGAKGRLFNDLDFGGYVEWRNPDRPAFLDARLEVAGPDRLAELVAAHESPAGWERLRAQWNPEILLLQHSSRGSAALLRSLLASGEWIPACFSPEAALLLSRAAIPVLPVRPAADEWDEILAQSRAPEPHAGRALGFFTEPLDRLLRPSPAPSAVRRAVRLANLHLTLEDVTAARGGYLAVLAVAPADPEALFNLGLCELRLGRRDEARRLWEDGLARVDRSSRSIFRRGLDELLRP